MVLLVSYETECDRIVTYSQFLLFCLCFNLALVEVLKQTISAKRDGRLVPPWEAHERIKKMYTWQNVAKRTERVSILNLQSSGLSRC